jgi:hypothetical protein
MTRHSFPVRLALARTMIARGTTATPVHLADQIRAAGSEVRQIHDCMATVMPLLEPTRNWRQRVDADPSETTRAYLLAAIIGCVEVCPHLRKGGPQPGIARLPLRRVDCTRCSRTLRRPPAADDDACDVCGRREVLTFFPFAMRSGPLLIAGDACAGCAAILGISEKAVAS